MNSCTSGLSTRAAAKPEPPLIGVGWAGSIGGSTKKSRSLPISSPGGTKVLCSMKLAWWYIQHSGSVTPVTLSGWSM